MYSCLKCIFWTADLDVFILERQIHTAVKGTDLQCYQQQKDAEYQFWDLSFEELVNCTQG